jgi:hypothetical protein
VKITLIREIKGSELVKDMEKEYGSMLKLEKLYEQNMDNLKLYSDLEDWKYYSKNPDEVLEDGKTIITEEFVLGEMEMKLLDAIKNEKPQSVNELCEMINSDMIVVYPKVDQLADYGLIEMTEGPRKTMVPVVKYHKLEID